jgi:hypothetical protein
MGASVPIETHNNWGSRGIDWAGTWAILMTDGPGRRRVDQLREWWLVLEALEVGAADMEPEGRSSLPLAPLALRSG